VPNSSAVVGFLLTYLLHATHAARLGSRAGLGITLINYGFSLRKNMEDSGPESEAASEAWQRIESWRSGASANFSTAAEAEAFYKNNNVTIPMLTEEQANQLIADATVEWLSFFLMTVGVYPPSSHYNNYGSQATRLVCPTHFCPAILPRQALGAGHHHFSAREP
jgi:hypothetical protein